MSKFTVPQESLAGLPKITFEFDGSLCHAAMAVATLTADVSPFDGDRANLSIVDERGEVLADVVVRKVETDKDITESVLRIGSALLWSHARYVDAKNLAPIQPPPGWTSREFDPAIDHVITPADIMETP